MTNCAVRTEIVLPLPLRERAGVRGKRETSDGVTSPLYP
jgi:hypothetical protein